MTHIECHRQRSGASFGDGVKGLGLFGEPVCCASRKCAIERGQEWFQGLDHRFLARHHHRYRFLPEQLGPDGVELFHHPFQIAVLELREVAHDVEHADPLQRVVQGAFGAELGLREQDGELESKVRDRALEARGGLRDDLPQPRRLDLEAGCQVCHQVDERFRVAIERLA